VFTLKQLGKGYGEISAWYFPAFPRRGKRLRVRLYSSADVNRWNMLAEFKVPNPTPGPYPIWKPTTLPATVGRGALSVSLVKLVSGSKKPDNGSGANQLFITAMFKVEQDGRETTDWLPQEMEATDASGNFGTSGIQSRGESHGLVYIEVSGTSLSPTEVWRLRVHFTKRAENIERKDETRDFEFLARPSRE
jgi:hypothetical protein